MTYQVLNIASTEFIIFFALRVLSKIMKCAKCKTIIVALSPFGKAVTLKEEEKGVYFCLSLSVNGRSAFFRRLSRDKSECDTFVKLPKPN